MGNVPWAARAVPTLRCMDESEGWSHENGPIQVIGLSEPKPDPRLPGAKTRLLILLSVLVITGFILSRAELEQPTDGVDIVERFRVAFDEGSAAALAQLLADAPTILTWSAGPPWGGTIQRAVELMPTASEPKLLHMAALDDYLAFHRALNGHTELAGCRASLPDSAPAALLYDEWVTCDFAASNGLLRVLSPDAPLSAGRMRVGLADGKIRAVLVESWHSPMVVPLDFLLWIRAERPNAAKHVLAERLTIPNYGADAAEQLLDLAQAYVATTRGAVPGRRFGDRKHRPETRAISEGPAAVDRGWARRTHRPMYALSGASPEPTAEDHHEAG